MSEQMDTIEAPELASDEAALIVDVDGFEGPLDLLLVLAKQQKVDLTKISILALADQYLAFIEEARRVRLELAADYLVMAAWLAYFKSRLLVPQTSDEVTPSAEELASALAQRLQRLHSIRAASELLMARPQLGRDTFVRGAPEPIVDVKRPEWSATLYDLLKAYSIRQKTVLGRVRLPERHVWSLAQARAALERLVGATAQWSRLDAFLVTYLVEPERRATVMASSFAATLELVREGFVDMHQHAPFQPIYLRKRSLDGAPPPGAGQ